MVYSWLLYFMIEYSPTCTICHCEKYRNFILFSGMEILRKDFQANTAETVCFYKISTRENLVKTRYFMQHIVLQNENIAENHFSTHPPQHLAKTNLEQYWYGCCYKIDHIIVFHSTSYIMERIL